MHRSYRLETVRGAVLKRSTHFLEHNILPECVDKLKQCSSNYTKKQVKWKE